MIHFFAPAMGFAFTAFPEARGFFAASDEAFAAIFARVMSINDKKARCPDDDDEDDEEDDEEEDDEEEEDKARSCHRSKNSV